MLQANSAESGGLLNNSSFQQFFRNGVLSLFSGPVFCGLVLLGIVLPLAAANLKGAKDYFDQGEYQSAVIELKNILQEDPNVGSARYLLGLVYLQAGDAQAAEKELSRALELSVDRKTVIVPLARVYLGQRKFDESLALGAELEQLPKQSAKAELLAIMGLVHLAKNNLVDAGSAFAESLAFSENAEAKVGQAKIAFLQEDAAASLELLDQVLKIEPRRQEALTAKAQVLASQHKYGEVVELINHWLAFEPESLIALLLRSESYIRLGELENARSDAEAALKINEQAPPALLILARLQLQAREYEAAQVSAEKVLRWLPGNLIGRFVLGASHYAQNNFEQAKFYLEQFVAQQAANAVATRLLGATYLQLGDALSAKEILELFDSSYEHRDAQLLNILGRAYLQNGEMEKGMAVLNRAVEIKPDLVDARTQLAVGQLVSGDFSGAVSKLEELTEQGQGPEVANLMLVMSYIREEKFGLAHAAIDQALEQFPGNAKFYNLRGLIYEVENDTKAARKEYETALSKDKTYLPALFALARLALAKGDVIAGEKRYQEALDINPKNLPAMIALAKIRLQDKDVVGYVQWLETARDANPESAVPVGLLTRHYLGNRELQKASAEASNFHSKQQSNVHALSLLAQVKFNQGKLDEARSLLEQIIALNDKDVNHRLQLVSLLANNKEYAQAQEQLDKVLALNHKYAPALAARVAILLAQKATAEARKVVESMVVDNTNGYLKDQLMGDVLVAEGDSKAALLAYGNAFKQHRSAYLVKVLAQHYSANGELGKASQTLSSYLEQTPADNANRLRLATIYQQLEQPKKAVEQYELLLERAPDNFVVLNNLAWLYWNEKDSRSLALAERAHRQAPERPEVIDTYGWIMLHQGDKKRALEVIQTAATKAPTNPDIRYHLAKAMNENGLKDQARKEVFRLLRDYSGFEEEQQAKMLLEELE